MSRKKGKKGKNKQSSNGDMIDAEQTEKNKEENHDKVVEITENGVGGAEADIPEDRGADGNGGAGGLLCGAGGGMGCERCGAVFCPGCRTRHTLAGKCLPWTLVGGRLVAARNIRPLEVSKTTSFVGCTRVVAY